MSNIKHFTPKSYTRIDNFKGGLEKFCHFLYKEKFGWHSSTGMSAQRYIPSEALCGFSLICKPF